MSDPLAYVPRQTSRSVWVFTVDIPGAEVDSWRSGEATGDEKAPAARPLRDALGLDHLDSDFVEVFPADNLDEYGLAKYLADANGFDEDTVMADAGRLDTLSGPLALVYSEALGHEPVILRPRAPLSFVGRYDTRPDLQIDRPILTEAARGTLSPDGGGKASPRVPSWPLLAFAIVLALAALVVWMLA